MLNSDQKSFDKGVGICACLHSKWIGFYTPRIHTRHDTIASSDNIRLLSDSLSAFAEQSYMSLSQKDKGLIESAGSVIREN